MKRAKKTRQDLICDVQSLAGNVFDLGERLLREKAPEEAVELTEEAQTALERLQDRLTEAGWDAA